MPAKAGIQNHSLSLDSRLRWNDEKLLFTTFYGSALIDSVEDLTFLDFLFVNIENRDNSSFPAGFYFNLFIDLSI